MHTRMQMHTQMQTLMHVHMHSHIQIDTSMRSGAKGGTAHLERPASGTDEAR